MHIAGLPPPRPPRTCPPAMLHFRIVKGPGLIERTRGFSLDCSFRATAANADRVVWRCARSGHNIGKQVDLHPDTCGARSSPCRTGAMSCPTARRKRTISPGTIVPRRRAAMSWKEFWRWYDRGSRLDFAGTLLSLIFDWKAWAIGLVGGGGTFLWAAIDGRSPLDVWVTAVVVLAALTLISHFWKLAVVRRLSVGLPVDYAPQDPELAHKYCEVTVHPQTKETTRVHRISVVNNFGRQTSGRLMVQSIRDKSAGILDFARQSLRSAEAERNGDFTLNNGQRIFFDVVAYYKGDPNQVFVCGSIGGAHYPIECAPFAISIEITGEGPPQQKRYCFDFDKGGDLIFQELA
jgi:hypothetical protein